MDRKAICIVCKRQIDTRKDSHYKFGRDRVCKAEGTDDCVIEYVGRHLVEREDNGSGRYNEYDHIGFFDY